MPQSMKIHANNPGQYEQIMTYPGACINERVTIVQVLSWRVQFFPYYYCTMFSLSIIVRFCCKYFFYGDAALDRIYVVDRSTPLLSRLSIDRLPH